VSDASSLDDNTRAYGVGAPSFVIAGLLLPPGATLRRLLVALAFFAT